MMIRCRAMGELARANSQNKKRDGFRIAECVPFSIGLECRQALAELGTQGADMALTLGKDQDHLKPGGVAHVLEQDRRPFGLLEPLIGGLDASGFAVGRPSCDRGLGTGLRYCHGTTLLSVTICLITRQKLAAACFDPYRRKHPRIGHDPPAVDVQTQHASRRGTATPKLNPSM